MAYKLDLGGVKPLDLSKIDSNSEATWLEWKGSFEIFAKINGITDPIMKELQLLHQGGTDLQTIYHNLPASSEVITAENNVYTIAIRKLDNYFVSKKVLVVERLKFRAIEQGNDSIDEFVLKLKQQAKKCDLKDATFECYMVDQIVEKCASNELRKRFFEKNLSLDEVILAAKAYEMAQNTVKAFQPERLNQIYSAKKKRTCFRCGNENHISTYEKCPALKTKCEKCNMMGHYTKYCKTKKRPNENRSNEKAKVFKSETVRSIDLNEKASEQVDYLFALENETGESHEMTFELGGIKMAMLIDSGASCNVIDELTWNDLKNQNVIVSEMKKNPSKIIRAYGSDKALEILGEFKAEISTPISKTTAMFYVIKNGTKCLLGRETATDLGVLKVGLQVNEIAEILKPFPKFKDIQVKIPIDTSIAPVCQPYRRVPIPMLEKIDKKLNELEKMDIIEKVENPSPWVSPMVIVFKGANDIRICIDMRQVNKAVIRLNHPLPTLDELLPELNDCRYFARLDIANAFYQIELHPDSRPITTFITNHGMYRYKRLVFGISAAPELFQKILEQILSDCEGSFNYIDDIIVYGRTLEILKKRVDKVMAKLKAYNILLRIEKCIFEAEELEFLGFHLSSKGIKPSMDKVKAVRNFRTPETFEELRSFLGLINFNSKFIKDFATHTEPLRALLKEKSFDWNKSLTKHFENLKEQLSESAILNYYNPKDQTRVIADASPYGLGAVLIQFHNKEPRVIYYAAKTLTSIEKRYSQCEKEALALVWAVERFHMFLFGKKFELVTDHKALVTIFKPDSKPCPRIQRWVLRMQSYDFNIIYCEGRQNIADPLSRLYTDPDIETKEFDSGIETHINALISIVKPQAIKLSEIESESKEDVDILAIRNGIENNFWDDIAKQYRVFESEFSFYGEILLRGNKIVIPKSLQGKTLELAHEGHPGITVMKRRLREKVWFLKIDSMTEEFVKRCKGCTLVAAPSRPIPMKRKELPTEAWVDTAVDFLGPLPNGQYLFVMVDYFSRFQIVRFMEKITSNETIKVLDDIFSYFGNPKSMIADNAKTFTSQEFQDYCEENNVTLMHSIPYWPQQNGEVERQNSSILKRLKIAHNQGEDLKLELNKYLKMYHSTPHSTTGKTPHELMFKKRPRDKLPMIDDVNQSNTEVSDTDKLKKYKGKIYADEKRHATDTELQEGDKVLVKNLIPTNKLAPNFNTEEFHIKKLVGGDAIIENEDGIEKRRNVHHLKKINFEKSQSADEMESTTESAPSKELEAKRASEPNQTESTRSKELEAKRASEPVQETNIRTSSRESRKRKAPGWAKDYQLDL